MIASLWRSSRRRRLAILGLAAGLAFVAAVAAWRIAFAWAASEGLLERLVNRRPELLVMSWTRAESPWPGRFEVWDLRLVGHAPSADWEVTAERASGDIQPLALFWRQLRFARMAGRGVAVQVDLRPAARPASAEPRADAPAVNSTAGAPASSSVPGVPGVPLAPLAVPRAAPQAKRPAWSFVLSNLAISDLRELRVDDRRLRMSARANGGFSLRRRTLAEVDSSEIAIESGQLVAGSSSHAEELRGRASIRILPWRYPGAGLAVVGGRLEGRVEVQGRLATEKILRYLFGGWAGLELGSAPGELTADLIVARGAVLPGSSLSLQVPRQDLLLLGFAAAGDAQVTAQTTGSADHLEQVELRSELALGHWTMARPGEKAFLLGDGLRLVATSGEPRIDRLPRTSGLEVDLGRARLLGMSALQGLLPETAGVTLDSGEAEITGRLNVAAGEPNRTNGFVKLQLANLGLVARGQRLAGNLLADFALTEADLAGRSVSLAGSRITLRDFAAPSAASAAVSGWRGDLTLPTGRLSLAQPIEFAGTFEARLSDTRPLITLYELSRGLPEWVERRLTIQDFSLQGGFRLAPGHLEIDDAVAPLTHGELRASLDLERTRRQGRMLLTWRQLAIGVELDNAGRRFRLRRPADWYAAEEPAAPSR